VSEREERSAPRAAVALAGQRMLVLTRAGLAPVTILYGASSGQAGAAFWALVAVRAAWQGAGAAATFSRHRRRYPERIGPWVELALLAGMIAASGGALSPIRDVMLAYPATVAFLFTVRRTAAIGVATLAAYLVAAIPTALEAGARGADARTAIALQVAGMAFATGAGVALAHGRTMLSARAARAEAARRRLLGASLSAEDRERRRVSQDLHGEALQVLLAARQDLDEAPADGRAALRRAEAGVRSGVALLRDTVRDLHPASVRHAGLRPAIAAALEHRVHGAVDVRVRPGAADLREDMLLSVVRELGDALAAGGHRDAVVVRVRRGTGSVVLSLDLLGTDPATLDVAACRERVQADGGVLLSVLGSLIVELPLEAGGPVLRAHERPPPATHAEDDDVVRRTSQRIVATVRAAAVPVLLAYGLAGEHTAWFTPLVLAGAPVAAAAVALSFSEHWRRAPLLAWTLVDLVYAGALMAASGGADSEIRAVMLVFPFLFALTFTPRWVVVLTGGLFAAYLAGAAGALLDADGHAWQQVGLYALALTWAGASSAGLSAGRRRINMRLGAAEEGRRRLLKDSLTAADAERRRLSERLHGEALQVLMAAGQDIDEAAGGDPEAAARAAAELDEGLGLLRDTVADLHPPRPRARRASPRDRRGGRPGPPARRLRGPRGRRRRRRRPAGRAGRRARARAGHQRRQARRRAGRDRPGGARGRHRAARRGRRRRLRDPRGTSRGGGRRRTHRPRVRPGARRDRGRELRAAQRAAGRHPRGDPPAGRAPRRPARRRAAGRWPRPAPRAGRRRFPPGEATPDP